VTSKETAIAASWFYICTWITVLFPVVIGFFSSMLLYGEPSSCLSLLRSVCICLSTVESALKLLSWEFSAQEVWIKFLGSRNS